MPAIISITAQAFKENSSATPPTVAAENCPIDLHFQINGPAGPATGKWNKRDANGEVFLCQDDDLGTIAVRRKEGKVGPVTLSFKIVSADGVPALKPLRMVFRQNDFRDKADRPKGDLDGSRNFTNQSVAGDLLTVENHWLDRGLSKDDDRKKRTAPHWKFWIQVKTDDGRLGWIDPGVENSEDMT